MRTLRYLLAMALVCALSGVARADDYQMTVVDPNPPANLITQIYSDNFSVTLSPCQSSQLFGLSAATYIGCFTGENDTGKPITSLQILIPVFNFNNQVDQPACAPVSQDIFTKITCGFTNNNKDTFVDLSGGNIPAATGINGDCDNDGDGGSRLNNDDVACNAASIFTIAEAGVPARDFPSFDVQANVTPEPSSIWLMSSGILSIGLFGAYRRRQAVCEARS
jgi:hypothetical protein